MLFEPQYEIYEGEDMSDLIGDEWMECDCEGTCTDCPCQGENDNV